MEATDSPGLWLMLCEYASVHKDGTMTVVRGGISDWVAPELPALFPVGIAGQVPAETFSPGKSPFVIFFSGPGIEPNPEPYLWGNLLVKRSNTPTVFCLPIRLQIPGPGRFIVEMVIGDDSVSARGSATIDVRVA